MNLARAELEKHLDEQQGKLQRWISQSKLNACHVINRRQVEHVLGFFIRGLLRIAIELKEEQSPEINAYAHLAELILKLELDNESELNVSQVDHRFRNGLLGVQTRAMCKKAEPKPREQKARRKFEEKVWNKGAWTMDEMQRFLQGVKLYGADAAKVREHLGTRSRRQVESQAQYIRKRTQTRNNIDAVKIIERHGL